MAQTIKLKRSATASQIPTTAQLELGELAINTNDGKVFLKKDNGTATVVEVGASPTNITTGNLSSSGNTVLGDAAADALTVNATSAFNAPADFNSSLNVDGAFSTTANSTLGDAAADTLTVNATSSFNAPADFNSSLNVDGAFTTTANSTLGNAAADVLTVNATSTFNAPADFNSSLNVDGAFTTTANTTLGNAAADTLAVKATATFDAPVDMNSSLNVDGATTLNGNVTLGDAAGDTITFNGTPTFQNGPSPSVTLTGAVTGTATMTNLGSISIATTNTADPVLTLSGDVTGTATFTNLGNATLTATVVESNIDHNSLANFVADEHIDHTAVSITAGNGLTGGGTIAAPITLNVGAGNGITVNADDVAMSGTYTGVFKATGGIQFNDGTTQTTAASGGSGAPADSGSGGTIGVGGVAWINIYNSAPWSALASATSSSSPLFGGYGPEGVIKGKNSASSHMITYGTWRNLGFDAAGGAAPGGLCQRIA